MSAFIQHHLPILPIVLPLLGAALALVGGEKSITLQRATAWGVMLLLLLLAAVAINSTAAGAQSVYLIGNWQAPFGIALLLDKLSAIMLALTAIVAAVSLYAAQRAQLDSGTYFTPLFMLQLMGLNGAFLTADLFNLFVFFEVLLAASYGLLLQQTNSVRTNTATHYVVINLIGSALFLIAVSLLYGVTGTLNMADLSQKIAMVAPASRGLVMAAGFMLVTVFAIKAALLPLNFWLTGTYGSAIVPVAALFALMTKVGVIAIYRTLILIFPQDSYAHAPMVQTLIVIAPLTMLVAAMGAIAARELKVLIGWSVVASAAMLVAALAIGGSLALSGALFYLIGSTLAAALLFLLAARIDETRAPVTAQTSSDWGSVGALFFIAAAVAAGLPPFSGFIGKAVVLAGATEHPWRGWIFAAVLMTGLFFIIAFARMGSRLLWKRDASISAEGFALPASVLAGLLIALSIFAAPVQRYTDTAANELRQHAMLRSNVLGERLLPGQKKVQKKAPSTDVNEVLK